jgi:hypothetical protein
MSNYLIKHFRGKYKIRTEYDKLTNTFPRKLNGNFEDINCYIDCQNNIQIFYYGKRGLLEAYIPSLGRGRNIIKGIYSEFVQDIENSPYVTTHEKENKNGELVKTNSYNYDLLYADEELNKIISDIYETDEEVLFKFHSDYMEQFEKYFKPKTSASDRSPFSTKNLPKTKYNIPEEDLVIYKNIVYKIPLDNVLIITHSTNRFIKSLATKKNPWENIKADMALKGISGKNYIHAIGKWDKYIAYLKENLCQN